VKPSYVFRACLYAAASLSAAAPTWVQAEVLIDFGVNASQIDAKIANIQPFITTHSDGYHVGAGVRRALEHGTFGVRLDVEDVGSDQLIALRALDYQHAFSERISVGGFIGAARLDLATPAMGYWLGASFEYRLSPKWAVSMDLHYGDRMARDNLLPSDPHGGSPDNFYSVRGIALYLSRRF
jgi:hypothetical protein